MKISKIILSAATITDRIDALNNLNTRVQAMKNAIKTANNAN